MTDKQKQILSLLDEISPEPSHLYSISEVARKVGVTVQYVFLVMEKFNHPRSPKVKAKKNT